MLEKLRTKQIRYIGRLPDENAENRSAQPWQDRFLTKNRKVSYRICDVCLLIYTKGLDIVTPQLPIESVNNIMHTIQHDFLALLEYIYLPQSYSVAFLKKILFMAAHKQYSNKTRPL